MLFRMYVDESGDHFMSGAALRDPHRRFLSLTGVWIDRDEVIRRIQPELRQLKIDYLRPDPDEPLPLHRKEMMAARGRFAPLRDPSRREQFDHELLACLSRWRFQFATIVLDKATHSDATYRLDRHPYNYCFSVLLERYIGNLRYQRPTARGDVLAESRGGKEDSVLRKEYERVYARGTRYHSAKEFKRYLSSKRLKLKRKEADVEGLQLADLISHPSRQQILRENGVTCAPTSPFVIELLTVLERKWNAYGRKLLK